MAGFTTVTGNQVTVFINGIQIDVLTTLRMTTDFGLEPVVEIGSINVVEYVPTVARYAISISKFLMAAENAITAGIINVSGADAMQGNVFDIEIFSQATGNLLFKAVSAAFTSGDISLQSNRLLVIDANFVALNATGNLNSVTG